MLDPYFDIKLYFDDEDNTDEKDEQDSLLVIGRGANIVFNSKKPYHSTQFKEGVSMTPCHISKFQLFTK